MSGQRSFYDVLGVREEASLDEIRTAFRRLARERHPDRFQGPERAAAEREFQAMTEAYNVLSDPARRERYDQSLISAPGKSQPSPRELARALLAKAVSLVKANQHAKAAEFFAQAVAHDPESPKAHHLYGMFLAQQLGRVDEGLRQLDQAVKLDANNVRVLLDASRLSARAKMFARAARLGQAASQLSPDDPAIVSWLAELQVISGRDGGAT